MRKELLNYIQCPVCAGSFSLIIIHETEIEIEKGILICDKCGYTTEFSDGIVNLIYNIDSDTIKELYLHVQDGKEMFEAELNKFSRPILEKRWAYMEQESSKEYGEKVKAIFWNALKSVKIEESDVVLDLGIGTGWSSAQLAKMSNYCIGVDLCKPIKLELSKVFFINENVFFERCMAHMMKLPIKDNCIDKVVCMAALHHASDLSLALNEISRVLRDKGELILIGEPVVPREYLEQDEEYIREKRKGFNEHQYTAQEWFRFIEDAGFCAKDGTNQYDDLNKYYLVDKNSLQTPLPVFVKKNAPHSIPLKIALVSQEFSLNCPGGICRYTYDLAHGLATKGHQVHVISKSEQKNEYFYKEGEVIIHKIISTPLNIAGFPLSLDISDRNITHSYAVCQKILELIKKEGIDIVEAPLWDAEGFVFSLIKPIPLVVRIETPLFKVVEIQGWEVTQDIKLANWIEGEAVRNADAVIAISSAIGNLISDHHSLSKERMVVSPLGVRIPEIGLLLPAQDKSTIEILFVGRLEKRKGVETLFKAIPQIIEKIPSAIFTIIGKDSNLSPENGSYKEYLLDHLERKYHSQINFVGFASDSDLHKYYKRCDVFVAPSLYESFGLIYLEAMAWGKPVIGCNIGGIPEIIHEGENGFLIPPHDHEALAQRIIDLQNHSLRVKMGQTGRKMVEEKFSMSRCIDETLKIYYKVCSNHQAG